MHEREDDEVSIMSVSEDMDNETLIPLKDRVPKSARSEASGTSGSRTPASRSSTVLQNNLDDALRQVGIIELFFFFFKQLNTLPKPDPLSIVPFGNHRNYFTTKSIIEN